MKETKETTPEEIYNRINAGIAQYNSDVIKMTDLELWEHCFADGDILETDCCTQELKKRFLTQQRQEEKEGQKEMIMKFAEYFNENASHYIVLEDVDKYFKQQS